MSLTRVVAWNTAVQVGGRIIGLVASVAVTALLTRHLGLATYGQFVAAATYVALFTIVGEAGVYVSTMRRAARDPGARAAVFGTALVLRLVLGAIPLVVGCLLLLMLPAGRFATWVPAVKLAVAVCAVNGYIALLGQLQIAVFRLHLRMDLAVLGEVLARVVALVGVGFVVWTGGGLVAACIAVTCGTAANFVYAWFAAQRFETIRPRLDGKLARAMLAESAALTAMTLLNLVHFKIDTLMLAVLQPPADVGIYGVAYKLHEVLITFPGLFIALLFPVFSRLAAEDAARLRQVFQRSFDVLVLTSVAAAVVVVVIAPAFSAVLGAPQAAHPMRILALALPSVFVGMGLSHLLLAEERQAWLVRLYAALVVANIALNWVAIRRWSYDGAAAVTVATEGLSVVCLLAYWLGSRRWRLELRSLWCVPVALVLAWLGDTVANAVGVTQLTGIARVVATVVLGGVTALAFAAAIVALRLLPVATLKAMWPGSRGAPDVSV